ncbi:MAG: alpha/beta fold hydrolase [Acidobacteriota bacterium]
MFRIRPASLICFLVAPMAWWGWPVIDEGSASAAAAVATAARPGSVAGKGEGEIPRGAIEDTVFEAADGRSVAAEAGWFEVPANRHRGGEERLTLRFVRFPSTADRPGAPIVYLAGGPGGSGIAAARGSRFELFQALRRVADVIAFDQRGTGASDAPEPCSQGWAVPLSEVGSRDVYEAAVRRAVAGCRDEWRRRGVDLDAFTTEESADDLEDLRRFLGVEKLQLWAISYGTHLAMSVMRRHPERIERAVLAGAEGPDHTLKRPGDAEAMLTAFAERPSADGGESALLADLERVLERLEDEPAEVALPSGELARIGPFDLRLLVSAMLRGPETMVQLPPALQAMAAGRFEALGGFLPRLRSGSIATMSAAMDVASGASPARRRLVAEGRSAGHLQGAINFPLGIMLETVPVRDLGESFRAPLESDIPALFISGTFDGRTPVSNAEELLPGFRRGAHLVLAGAGHSDPLFLSSPLILERMETFFGGGSVARRERIEVPFPRAVGGPAEIDDRVLIRRRIEDFVDPFVELAMFDGRVVVDVAGEVVFDRSFGLAHYELGLPHRADTRFRIASVSKTLTDAAVARLVRRGALDPTAPLARYLPDFPNADEIIVAQLLDHSSGIPHSNAQPWGNAKTSLSLDEIVARLAELPLDFPPGENKRYSNGGYAVLAKVMEVAGGGTYDQVLEDTLFEPLGMKDSGHLADARHPVPAMATGYEPGPVPGERRHARFYAVETRPGGGSLYSTTGDLLTFVRAVFREGFLSGEERQRFLGADDGIFSSQGRSPGFVAKVLYDPADDVIVVSLANSYAVPAGWAEAIAELATGSEKAPWEAPEGAVKAAPELNRVAAKDPRIGRYRSSYGGRPVVLERSPEGFLVESDVASDSRPAMIPLGPSAYLQPLYFSRCELEEDSGRIACRMLSGDPRYDDLLTPESSIP